MILEVQPPIGRGGSTLRVVFQHEFGIMTLLDTPNIPYITNQMLISIISSFNLVGTFGYGSTYSALTYASDYFTLLEAQVNTSVQMNISEYNQSMNASSSSSSASPATKGVMVLFNGNDDINQTEIMLSDDLKQNGTAIYAIGTSNASQLEGFKALASSPPTAFAYLCGGGGDVSQFANLMSAVVSGGK